MTARQSACKARQHSDQMACVCGLAWDMNDPEPPECRKVAVARQELTSMRVILAEPKSWSLRKKHLLTLQEMPLRHLPSFGIAAGLYTLDWPSLPDVRFVVVDFADEGLPSGQGRDYRFFDKKGHEHLAIRRRECIEGNHFAYRYPHGEWQHE